MLKYLMQEGLPPLSRTLFKQTTCLFCIWTDRRGINRLRTIHGLMQHFAGSVIIATGLFVVATGPVLCVFVNIATGLFVANAALVLNSTGTLLQGVLIIYLYFDFTIIYAGGFAAGLSTGSVMDTAGLFTQGFSINFINVNFVSFFVFITSP